MAVIEVVREFDLEVVSGLYLGDVFGGKSQSKCFDIALQMRHVSPTADLQNTWRFHVSARSKIGSS